MSDPVVTIVTPAYNAERYLQDTLRSVLFQTYRRIEHIVIDDGSADNTVEILKKYKNKYYLKYFSKPNEGQAITVNKGFDLAEGDIVVWLNADDVLFDKYVIESVVKKFNSDPLIDVVYGHLGIIDENNNLIKIQNAPLKVTYNLLISCHPVACVFYRRRVIKRYKLDVSLNYAMDYEQCLRMCHDGVKFGFLNRVLIGWRRHKTAKSISKKTEAKLEMIRVMKKYNQKFDIDYYFKKYFVYYPYLYAFKALGIIEVAKVYKQRDRLAFNADFDHLLKIICRQLVPFIT